MKNIKKILALVGAVFFSGLYISLFIIAFLDIPYKEAIMQSILFTTFFLALFIACFAIVLRLLKRLNGSDDRTTDKTK